jgi:DNA (cytosine-5)-methyltransferase 1
VSDTRAYKQFGNAVVVPVVEAIARHMARWLGVSGLPELPDDSLQMRLPFNA